MNRRVALWASLAVVAVVGLWLATDLSGQRIVSTGDAQLDPEIQRFEELAARYGLRTEDWYVAYFHRPRDVVFDDVDPDGFDEFSEPGARPQQEFNDFVAGVDSNGDGRHTLLDDGFDPQYGAQNTERFDLNADGILSEHDLPPRPSDSLVERIRRIRTVVAEQAPLYAGRPAPRSVPEATIEERAIELQERLSAWAQSNTQEQRVRGVLVEELRSLIAQRAAVLSPRIERGKAHYVQRCAGCHGVTGRGDGPAGRFIGNDLSGKGTLPLPRDFTRGAFRFQSREVGFLPTDGDLFATVRRGVPGSAMPGFSELSDQQVWDLVDYVKHLADEASLTRYDEVDPQSLPTFTPLFLLADRLPEVEPIPDPPADTLDLRGEGRYAFMLMQCYTCHGTGGEGDGTSGLGRDSQGRLIHARDLRASPELKAGSSPQDIYRTLTNGIGTTPMPAHPDEVFLISSAAPAEFLVAVPTLGADDAPPEEFFEEDEGLYNGNSEGLAREVMLIPGVTQEEVDRIKAYVAGLPSTQELQRMPAEERLRRADRRRWALVYYIRSLLPDGRSSQ